MTALRQYQAAEALERELGDPNEPESPLSFAYSRDIDESERFPEEALNWLYARRVNHQFVPEALGGRFTSFEELASVIRILSRRDLSCSISMSTLFWSFLTWIAGTPEQKTQIADFILNRDGAMCLAYSEREHGSDLIAGESQVAES